MLEIIKAIILGIIQGITEFLPVSSSGHIELGKKLLDTNFENDNITFSLMVHLATVLSTVIVFRKDIFQLLKSLFQFKWNDDTRFIAYILISMIPVTIIGVFFKEYIELLFDGNIAFVGVMLILNGAVLYQTKLVGRSRHKEDITPWRALVIGIAQAIAVLPGISRSGATISTGILLNIDKEKIARFSFLMVIPPILGASILDLNTMISQPETLSIDIPVLSAGFVSAFILGLIACKAMISIVRQGKIQYFSYYCFIIGLFAIALSWF